MCMADFCQIGMGINWSYLWCFLLDFSSVRHNCLHMGRGTRLGSFCLNFVCLVG